MSNYNGQFEPGEENNNWNMAYDRINENTIVLDVGCSKGSFGEALIHFKNCVVDGIEPDAGDANIATEKLNTVVNDSIEEALKYQLKDRKYDHIVFLDVIEHLYDPVGVLKKLKEHLKPGGSVIFSIPNMSHISVRIMLLAGNFDYGQTGILDNTHLHFYTEAEINRVFNDAGYAIDFLAGVTVYYENKVLAAELNKIGISRTVTELNRVLRSSNSHIFQYVGSAKVWSTPKKRKIERAFSSPDPKGTLKSYYQIQIEEQNEVLKRQLIEKDRELERITHSKSWRLIRLIRRLLP